MNNTAIDKNDIKPIWYVIITDGFRWSIGESLKEAAERLSSRKKEAVILSLVLDSTKPEVDGYCFVSYGGANQPDARLVNVGRIGTVGSVLRGNK